MSINLTTQLEIDKRKKIADGLFRKLPAIKNMDDFCNFSSNDYLSLTIDPKVSEFYQAGYRKYPTGSTGSLVISGYSSAHADLDKYLAETFAVDGSLLFSSGYIANLSVVSLLAAHRANLIIDKAVHASIYDGIKFSKVNYERYLHNDLASLTKKLDNCCFANLAVITESIFSMSGQIADLATINSLVKAKNGVLIVDEAHAFGVVGMQGLGSVVAHNLTQNEVPLRIIPLGKAGGAYGALVLGQKIWLESLLQMRQAVYSTAVSPAVAYGLLRTIDYIRSLDNRREKLQNLIQYFKQLILSSNLKWRNSDTHIQQLQLGCPHLATKISENLLKLGIICLPIREPTVTKPETGLRIILNYQHTEAQIQYLFNSLNSLLA